MKLKIKEAEANNAMPLVRHNFLWSTDEYNEPPSVSLNDHGNILDCNSACEQFLGYRRGDLILQHVSVLFPQLAKIDLMQKGCFNPSLVFLCRCGKLFQAYNRVGDTFLCNLNFVQLENNGGNTLKLIASVADNSRTDLGYSFIY